MQTGKVSEITYKRSILKKLATRVEGTYPGVDGAPMKLEDIMAVMSSNCILKWFSGCESYYLQKTINGIYEQGGVPKYVQLTINIPTDFEERQLGRMIQRFSDAAAEQALVISQCRTYAGAVQTPVAHVTVIGKAAHPMTRQDIRPGMDVVMAGSIAVGGAAVLASLYEQQLQEKFAPSFVRDCLALKKILSTEKIARIAIDCGAVSVHNISDGGAFGAIWELVSSVDLGITVDIAKIPVWQEVIEVSEALDANPYLLDGTGAMLIVCHNGAEMVHRLTEEGILADVIGTVTDSKDRIAVKGDETRYLEPPRGDEFYRVLGKGW